MFEQASADHADGGPSIVGPRRLVVGESGWVQGAVEQHVDLTEFAFENGCSMRLNIVRQN